MGRELRKVLDATLDCGHAYTIASVPRAAAQPGSSWWSRTPPGAQAPPRATRTTTIAARLNGANLTRCVQTLRRLLKRMKSSSEVGSTMTTGQERSGCKRADAVC